MTPEMPSIDSWRTMRTASSAKTWSASPETTASTNANWRTVSTPIVASQLAPPMTMKVSGSRAFSRLASAREARCCWKTLVNPTTRGRSSTTRSAHRSTYAAAASRAANSPRISPAVGGRVLFLPSHDGGGSRTSAM